MLCYRSSRDAADVVHDTFLWLGLCRHAFAVIAVPLLAVCFAALMLMHSSFAGASHSLEWWEEFFRQLLPFGFGGNKQAQADAEQSALGYCLIAFVATLLVVPLLRRYFIDRHSIRRITMRQLFSLLARSWASALSASLLTAVLCYALINFNGTLMCIALPFIIVQLPRVAMSSRKSMQFARHWWTTIKSLFYIILLFCVIHALPLFCISLVQMLLELLSEIMTNVSISPKLDSPLLLLLMTFLTNVSFAAAIIVFHVSALMLHGTVCEESKL